jgi:adenylate cyclase class 2
MYEVELKVRADHAPVREALGEAGAEPAGAVVQEDIYYDAPHRSFAETDEALRLRVERPAADEDADTTVTLTYKGPLVETESKTRTEREVDVADVDDAGAILEAVGFEPAAVVNKERERHRLGEYTVTLDAVDGLGEFVEVETHAEAVETAREGARRRLAELGLDPDDHVRTSYLGLLMDNQ